MQFKDPLLYALELKTNIRTVLKAKFKAGVISKEELYKRCLELTKKHD